MLSLILAAGVLAGIGCGKGDGDGQKAKANGKGADGNQTVAKPKSGAPKTNPGNNATTPGADLPLPAIQRILAGLANNKPVEVWNGLPKAYQEDVIQLIQEAQGIDPEILEKASAIFKRVAKVGREKKAIVIRALGARPEAGNATSTVALLAKNYDSVISLLDALANSDLGDPAWLRNPDVGKFLETTGPKLMASGLSVVRGFNPNSLIQNVDRLRGAKAELDPGNPNLVKVVMGTNIFRWTCRKVDDKWLPQGVINDWQKILTWGREKIRSAIGMALSSQQKAQRKANILKIINEANEALNQVEQAQTVEGLNLYYAEAERRIGRLFGYAPIPAGRLAKWVYGGKLQGHRPLMDYLRLSQATLVIAFGPPDKQVRPQNPNVADVLWIYNGLKIIDVRDGKSRPRTKVYFGIKGGSVNGVYVE